MGDFQKSVQAAVERALRLSLGLDDEECTRVAIRVCQELALSPDYALLRSALGDCPSRVLRLIHGNGRDVARYLRAAYRIVGGSTPCRCHLCVHYPSED